MRLFLLLLLLCSYSFGLGHTSVTTINASHGSENIALGETGAALSNSLSSSFYNPANGALYGKRENINSALSCSFGFLLPSWGFRDLWRGAINVGAFAPDAYENWSFGMIYSMNFLHWGNVHGFIESDTKVEDTLYDFDANGDTILVEGYFDSYRATESVHSYSFSASYKNMFAWGIGLSNFNSRLFFDTQAKGVVVNLGFRSQKEFSKENGLYLIPGTGISLVGINNDSVDYDGNKSTTGGSPTSITLYGGLSIEGGKKDIIYGTVVFDINQEVVKDSDGRYDDPILKPGLQVGFTPFLKVNSGFVIDKQGKRRDFLWGTTVGFKQLRVRNYLRKRFGFVSKRSHNKNVQIEYSFSKCNSLDYNIYHSREITQTLNFAMGFGKKRKTEDLVERDELPLWEE